MREHGTALLVIERLPGGGRHEDAWSAQAGYKTEGGLGRRDQRRAVTWLGDGGDALRRATGRPEGDQALDKAHGEVACEHRRGDDGPRLLSPRAAMHQAQ